MRATGSPSKTPKFADMARGFSDLASLEQAILTTSLEPTPPISSHAKGPNSHGTTKESKKVLANDVPTTPNPIHQTKARGTASTFKDGSFDVFGILPDQIHLHEQLGEFDGQVIFIGHPNRDVSAHQWSSKSFQWENIGRYSQVRGKVEGSLASDRLKNRDTSLNPLMCFELAAKARETQIVDHGRVEEEADVVLQSVSAHPAQAVRPPSNKLSTRGTGVSSHLAKGSTRFQHLRPEQRGEPFIKNPPPGIKLEPTNPLSGLGASGRTGSLDFKYQFPEMSTSPVNLIKQVADNMKNSGESSLAVEQRAMADERPQAWDSRSRIDFPSMGKFGFDNMNTSYISSSAEQGLRTNLPTNTYQPTAVPQKAPTSFFEPGEPTNTLGGPISRQKPVPRFSTQQPTARSMFPLPGLTIANPHRTAPATHAESPACAPETDLSPLTDSLRFDNRNNNTPTEISSLSKAPDGNRLVQAQEGTHGFPQYRPTPQNFNGPFFTNTTPTRHDPTIPLSTQIKAEEDLEYWFQDSYRPRRQKEFNQSLMSMTSNSNTNQYFGAMGEGSSANPENQNDNTALFVRLFENLSEYVGPNRRDDYFTRAWKPAPLHPRDPGPDGSPSTKKQSKEEP